MERGINCAITFVLLIFLKHATEQKLFCRFSEGEFHGATECLELDDKTLKLMTDKSNEMHSANL